MIKVNKIKPEQALAMQLVNQICDLQEDLGHMPYNVEAIHGELMDGGLADQIDDTGAQLTKEVHQKIGRLTERLSQALKLADPI